MSYEQSESANVATTTLSPEAAAYLNRLMALGAFEGPIGDMKLNPSLVPVFQALHNVLAGGTARVEIASPGNADVVGDLNLRMELAINETNTINAAAGFQLAAIP